MKWILFTTLLAFLPGLLIAQDESKYSINLSGFISYESIFDTRQTVSAREGDVLIFSARVSRDLNGEDVNAQPSFNMFAVHSRLKADVTGPDIFGARSTALLEFDFLGNSDPAIGLVRLRHSIIKLDWGKATVFVGQYWHPMFVTSSFPEVSSWGGGAPLAAFSRNPQIRFDYNLSHSFSAGIIALTQRDFSTTGPVGGTPDYLRNSGIPELNLHLGYQDKGWNLGVVSGYKIIKPRLADLEGQKLDETLGSWHTNAYIRKDWPDFTIKVQGLYGQNMHDFLMMGGYGEFIDSQTNEITYSNWEIVSLWTEWLYRNGNLTYSVFGGYSENLGLADEPGANDMVNFYGRGVDINYTYRVSPRLTLQVEKFQIMGEIMYSAAAYGSTQSNGAVSDTEVADNWRFQLHLKYSF